MESNVSTPKTSRGEATRRAILDAAERVIGRDGYSESSITEITRAAGVAQGTFYIYFKSKEEVFRALVIEMGRMLRRGLTEAAETASNRLQAEKEGLRSFLSFAKAHPNLYRIIQEAQFVAPEAYRAYFQSFGDNYREGLEKAEQLGEISKGDAEIRAWALMGMAKNLGERYAMWNETRPIDEVVEVAHRLIADGLNPKR